jgi:hypothetical protein
VTGKPSIEISVYLDELLPVVFSTALKPSEQRTLDAWLDENPELKDLVRFAVKLADREGDDEERRG